jgi:hypothetical protein
VRLHFTSPHFTAEYTTSCTLRKGQVRLPPKEEWKYMTVAEERSPCSLCCAGMSLELCCGAILKVKAKWKKEPNVKTWRLASQPGLPKAADDQVRTLSGTSCLTQATDSNTSVRQHNTGLYYHTDCKGKLRETFARSHTAGPPTNQFATFKITKQTGILWTSRTRAVVSTKLWKFALRKQCNGLFQGHHTDCTTVDLASSYCYIIVGLCGLKTRFLILSERNHWTATAIWKLTSPSH